MHRLRARRVVVEHHNFATAGLDLLLNFAFAIPEMIGMLINGIQRLLNIDGYLFAAVELFFSVLMVALYFIGIVQLLGGMRSGRTIE